MSAGFLNGQKVNYHLECSAGYNPGDGDKWLCFAVSQSREAKHSKIFTRTHLVITAWRELSIPNQHTWTTSSGSLRKLQAGVFLQSWSCARSPWIFKTHFQRLFKSLLNHRISRFSRRVFSEITGREDDSSSVFLVDYCFIVSLCILEHNRRWRSSHRWDLLSSLTAARRNMYIIKTTLGTSQNLWT